LNSDVRRQFKRGKGVGLGLALFVSLSLSLCGESDLIAEKRGR
jgi:hypothetical protein